MPQNKSLKTKEIYSDKFFVIIVMQIYAPHLLTKTALRSAAEYGQRSLLVSVRVLARPDRGFHGQHSRRSAAESGAFF